MFWHFYSRCIICIIKTNRTDKNEIQNSLFYFCSVINYYSKPMLKLNNLLMTNQITTNKLFMIALIILHNSVSQPIKYYGLHRKCCAFIDYLSTPRFYLFRKKINNHICNRYLNMCLFIDILIPIQK